VLADATVAALRVIVEITITAETPRAKAHFCILRDIRDLLIFPLHLWTPRRKNGI
jgi:hypothetical protein